MPPHLIVETLPVNASAVYVRQSGSGVWQSAADHTPVSLELAAQTYDVQVEAPDGLFFVYHGEVTGVRPGYDHPVIEMQAKVNGPIAIPVALAVLVGAGTLAWRRLRRLQLQRPLPKPAAVAEPVMVERVLPPLNGATLQTEGGRPFYIERETGRGEMGIVYDAIPEPPDGHRYAVKILRRVNTDRIWRRFEREIRLCMQLRHPNIVQVVASGVYRAPDGNPWPFMVMERLDGNTLRFQLKEGSPTLSDAVWWVIEILRALQAAHEVRIIHRDLKPENIMLTYEGRVKVMDFGVACQLGENDLTRTGQALGTPVYMSPEHLNAKETTAASDVYSVGVIFYEALSGAYPHEASDVWGLIGRKITEPPIHLLQRRPDLDRELCRIIMGMLLTNPDKRYHSAQAVLDDLEPWARRTGVYS